MLELIYRLDLGSSAERIEGLSPSRSTIFASLVLMVACNPSKVKESVRVRYDAQVLNLLLNRNIL